ncbi:MAG: hypothetical protein IKK29_01515 [Christensenellaceae bacterium]|nr:hypothetical protein [Christensenellaceae bacterium]
MKKLLCLLLIVILLLSGCNRRDRTEEDWGSFTAEKAYSYDKKYYAVQTVVEHKDNDQVKVSVYLSADDSFVDSFIPARACDFWGICWESESYNIWIQSADIGIYCYKYETDTWTIDESAVQPDDIISKFDNRQMR